MYDIIKRLVENLSNSCAREVIAVAHKLGYLTDDEAIDLGNQVGLNGA